MRRKKNLVLRKLNLNVFAGIFACLQVNGSDIKHNNEVERKII